MEKKKYNVKGYAFEAFNLPQIIESKTKDWVLFGADNKFPDKLIDMYNNSAMHKTALESIIAGLTGRGIKVYGDTVVNAQQETFNEVYDKVATDFAIHGGYALNCIWNKGADKIVELYHLPFDRIRSGKMNPDTDTVDYYYYSTDWSNTRKIIPTPYRAFDPTDNKKENASQILYFKDYTPGDEYYPLPTYSGALNDIELDIRISRFHNSNISNGLAPSMAIQFRNGEPTEDERQQIYKDIKDTFAGQDNAGRFWITFSEPGTEPIFTPIQAANDTYYTTLEQRISSRILTGHRITSPLLLGIRDGGGLGSNTDEIKMAYSHYLGTVIVPKQQVLLKSLQKPFRLMGYTVNLEVEQAEILVEDSTQTTITPQA